MREIEASAITQAVAELCRRANYELGDDVRKALERAQQSEESPLGREVLNLLIQNATIAAKGERPLCQDCGSAVVFLEVGQDVHIRGDFVDAITKGVRRGYGQNYLRKSMVAQPFSVRKNTGDNTPPIIHTEIVPGDKLKISLMSKGSGAENMSRLVMLKPAAGAEGIVNEVVAAVSVDGGSPCPPLVIGLGIGGTVEKAMFIAKKALLRPLGQPNPDAEVAALEKKVLQKVNDLGVGPLGFGGSVTAIAVHAEVLPTHIASLPLAINLQCHSARHKVAVL